MHILASMKQIQTPAATRRAEYYEALRSKAPGQFQAYVEVNHRKVTWLKMLRRLPIEDVPMDLWPMRKGGAQFWAAWEAKRQQLRAELDAWCQLLDGLPAAAIPSNLSSALADMLTAC